MNPSWAVRRGRNDTSTAPEPERLEESRCRVPLDACTLEIPIVGPDLDIGMKGQGIDVVRVAPSIRRSASHNDAAYSSRSTTVTGSVVTANSTVPSGRRSLRASGSAYSLTSSRAAAVVTTSARSARARTSRARLPVTAASRTLASATSRTPGLAPRLEAGLDVLLAQPLTPDAACDRRAQAAKELALQLEGQRGRWRWKEDPRQPSPARDENGIPRAQKAGRLVTELC